VWGLGFRVKHLPERPALLAEVYDHPHPALRVWGLGFGVWGLGWRILGLGIGAWGLGFGVWGLEFGVDGSGFRVKGAPPGPCGRTPRSRAPGTACDRYTSQFKNNYFAEM